MHWLMSYTTRVTSVCLSMPGDGISSTPDISLTAPKQFLWIIPWNFLQSGRNCYPSTDSLQWSGNVACFTPQSIIIPLWLIILEPDTDVTRCHLLRLAICVPLSSKLGSAISSTSTTTNQLIPAALWNFRVPWFIKFRRPVLLELVNPLELPSFIH
jgi:hypothetical protein